MVGRHTWDRRKHGPAPTGRFAGLSVGSAVGVAAFVFGLFFGIGMVTDPARCDGRPMAQGQICQHFGKAGERLIDAGARPPVDGYDLAGQVRYNHSMGAVLIAAGVLTIAGVGWFVYSLVRDLWQERQWRREQQD